MSLIGWFRSRITLRDYFAAQAMTGLLQMPCAEMVAIYGHASVCKAAYEQADAMLKARTE